MRSIIFSFVLAMLLSCAAIASAGEIQESPDGSLRIAEERQEWANTGVRVEDAAAAHEAWREAYRNPGTIVPVATHTERVADGFTITVSTVADEAVVYEEDAGVVRFVTDAGVMGEKTIPNLPAALIGFAVMMMVVSNACVWWGRRSATFAAAFAFAFAFVAAAAFAAAAFAAAAFAAAAFAAASVFAAFFAFVATTVAEERKSSRVYTAASVFFYLVAFIAIVLMFA